MLRCEFKGLPGESLVAQNLYYIINERFPRRILTSSNWEATALPGMRLKMSMIVSSFFARKGQCPWYKCSSCQKSACKVQNVMTW